MKDLMIKTNTRKLKIECSYHYLIKKLLSIFQLLIWVKKHVDNFVLNIVRKKVLRWRIFCSCSYVDETVGKKYVGKTACLLYGCFLFMMKTLLFIHEQTNLLFHTVLIIDIHQNTYYFKFAEGSVIQNPIEKRISSCWTSTDGSTKTFETILS